MPIHHASMRPSDLSPRLRFFNEVGDMLPPFSDPAWRGCVLDRSRFDATQLSEVLFNALMHAAKPTALHLAPSTPDLPIESIAPHWQALRHARLDEARQSLEYILFDESGEWALLGEFDVTVLGAAPELADRIDACLAEQGTSLRKLTEDDYPELDQASNKVVSRWIAAVVGGPR